MLLGAGDGYTEKKAADPEVRWTLFLPDRTRSCHCDLHGVKETTSVTHRHYARTLDIGLGPYWYYTLSLGLLP